VLGPVTVEAESGERVAPGGRKQRQLLASLLLHAPGVASADGLIDCLWPGRLPDDPSAALQTQVSRLRTFLRDADPAADIEREPYGYRLVGAGVGTDASRFEDLIEGGRSAASPLEGLASFDRALALWDGRPYAEFAGVEPFEAEAARLEEVRLRAEERRAEILLSVGRYDEAREASEALVARDPFREGPRALYMEALYRSGRQADALETYRDYRRLLSEELGLEPSPAIRRLELEILRHQTASAEGTEGVTPGSGRPVHSPPDAPDIAIRFVDGPTGRIAFGIAGEGPALLVPPGWLSSLPLLASGADPRARFYAQLTTRFRAIFFDRCGMGLSTGGAPFSLENDVTEALTVLDAAEVPTATILALSQAGPPAIDLAVSHPDRVTALALCGTYASGPRTYHREDVRESMLALIRASWGLGAQMFADLIIPDAPGDVARGFARLQRQAATRERAAEALEQMFTVDVTDLLSRVTQPTLVIHYERDRAVPSPAGRELAAMIPGARLLTLEGTGHLPRPDDIDRLVDAVAELMGAPSKTTGGPDAGPGAG
jgi:DNA-binding SARP family transcriptional activator/pimeloyl-ACP methyl ester carboxylesterase